MSKKSKLCIVVALIFVILGIQVSSTIAVKDSALNNEFFYTNKQEISIGEILEMTLDISKTKYDEFEFKLSSNLDTKNIVISEEIKAENYNNDISINIDKSKTNLDKITFYYKVPENSQIGTKIELVAQIIITDERNQEQNIVSTNTVENTTIDTNTNEINNLTTDTDYIVVENKKIDIEIVEKKQNENQERPKEQESTDKNNLPNEQENTNSFEKNDKLDIPNNNEKSKMSEDFEDKLSTNTEKSMSSTKVQNISYSANTMNFSSMPLQEETAIYNGSNNNYLSSLEIEGENLNTTFNKDNTTYFIQTNGKTELNVKATAEDENAKIYVTGNENLKTGDNKILISVTAENGDVRYYRVFVTKN